MNYIGSKQKLAPWIKSIIEKEYSGHLTEAVFADLFAGTGQVARHMKSHVQKVIVNDIEDYSYVLNKHYIGNCTELEPVADVEKMFKGIVYKNFTEQSKIPRKYFTENNAQKIDGIRRQLEKKHTDGSISDEQFYWGLASLIESADKVANTTSVYGAFLKNFKASALKDLNYIWMPYLKTDQVNDVYQEDANDLIHKISGDILYLDPPYNARQYGANYHVLNKIVENKKFDSKLVTGLTDYNKSNYCKKDKVYEEFDALIKAAQFKYVFISYNNEGLISLKEFKTMLEQYGEYSLHRKVYKRYKADAKRPNQPKTTYEYLHVLKKF